MLFDLYGFGFDDYLDVVIYKVVFYSVVDVEIVVFDYVLSVDVECELVVVEWVFGCFV